MGNEILQLHTKNTLRLPFFRGRGIPKKRQITSPNPLIILLIYSSEKGKGREG